MPKRFDLKNIKTKNLHSFVHYTRQAEQIEILNNATSKFLSALEEGRDTDGRTFLEALTNTKPIVAAKFYDVDSALRNAQLAQAEQVNALAYNKKSEKPYAVKAGEAVGVIPVIPVKDTYNDTYKAFVSSLNVILENNMRLAPQLKHLIEKRVGEMPNQHDLFADENLCCFIGDVKLHMNWAQNYPSNASFEKMLMNDVASRFIGAVENAAVWPLADAAGSDDEFAALTPLFSDELISFDNSRKPVPFKVFQEQALYDIIDVAMSGEGINFYKAIDSMPDKEDVFSHANAEFFRSIGHEIDFSNLHVYGSLTEPSKLSGCSYLTYFARDVARKFLVIEIEKSRVELEKFWQGHHSEASSEVVASGELGLEYKSADSE